MTTVAGIFISAPNSNRRVGTCHDATGVARHDEAILKQTLIR
jgi:hypothetical protein